MDRLDEFTESYGWAPAPDAQAERVLPAPVLDQLRPGRAHDGRARRLVGADTLIWASDFPHSDAQYPGVVDELREHTTDMAPEARAKLLGGNALRLYGLAGPGAVDAADRARV